MTNITTATLRCMAENYRRRSSNERPLTTEESEQLSAILRELQARESSHA